MDAREEVASLLEKVKDQPTGIDQLALISMAALRLLNAIDEDLQKLRKELRTRNGGEVDG